MTTTTPQPLDQEAQLRQLLVVARSGVVTTRELDGLMDRYAADAVVGRPGIRSQRQSETRRACWR